MTACPVNLCVRDEVNNLKATWSLSKRSDIWNPSLTLCLLSDMWTAASFSLPCLLNLSPNLWSVDPCENIIVLFVLLSHILWSCSFIRSLTFPVINIYLHPYTALFYVPLLYIWTHLQLHQKPFNLIAILDFTFLSPPSSPSLHSGGLFFSGSVQPSTARPLSPRRASFPSCSLCVGWSAGWVWLPAV